MANKSTIGDLCAEVARCSRAWHKAAQDPVMLRLLRERDAAGAAWEKAVQDLLNAGWSGYLTYYSEPPVPGSEPPLPTMIEAHWSDFNWERNA